MTVGATAAAFFSLSTKLSFSLPASKPRPPRHHTCKPREHTGSALCLGHQHSSGGSQTFLSSGWATGPRVWVRSTDSNERLPISSRYVVRRGCAPAEGLGVRGLDHVLQLGMRGPPSSQAAAELSNKVVAVKGIGGSADLLRGVEHLPLPVRHAKAGRRRFANSGLSERSLGAGQQAGGRRWRRRPGAERGREPARERQREAKSWEGTIAMRISSSPMATLRISSAAATAGWMARRTAAPWSGTGKVGSMK